MPQPNAQATLPLIPDANGWESLRYGDYILGLIVCPAVNDGRRRDGSYNRCIICRRTQYTASHAIIEKIGGMTTTEVTNSRNTSESICNSVSIKVISLPRLWAKSVREPRTGLICKIGWNL